MSLLADELGVAMATLEMEKKLRSVIGLGFVRLLMAHSIHNESVPLSWPHLQSVRIRSPVNPCSMHHFTQCEM
jgi:hypothetical protein